MDDKKLINSLGECEILCQLAEEASELAQAALKLRRAIDGTNPTPKTKEQCLDAMIEEMADVQLCGNIFLSFVPEEYILKIHPIKEEKKRRWENRLAEKEAKMNEPEKCKFCSREKCSTESEWFDISLVHVTPLSSVNLITCETSKTAKEPFFAMNIGDDEDKDFIEIKFCPFCGRNLERSHRKAVERSEAGNGRQ